MAIQKRGDSYRVTYRVPGEASPRTETFKSEDEALIRDAQIRLQKKNNSFEPPVRKKKGEVGRREEITVKDFMDEFVEKYGLKKWSNSFYSSNIGLIKNYIVPYLGDRYVRSITVKDMDDYYTMLLSQPAVVISGHMDTGARISAYTVQRIHKLLKCAFGKAVTWNYTEANPTLGTTLPEAKSAERAVWSDAEAIQALNLCVEESPLHLCLYLALGCSMRLGEILGLQWANIHMEDSLVANGEAFLQVDRELQRCENSSIEAMERVNRSTIIFKFPSVMPKKASTTLVLKPPKTESSKRTIYLPDAVVAELRKAKKRQESYKLLLGTEYKDYDLVVSQINGRPYEIRIIDKMLYRLIQENHLRPVVFHSLRHSSTSLKLKLSKGNIKAVQGDTGHAEARMVTDTYAHGFDEDRKIIAHEMDSGFFSKVGETERAAEPDPETVAKLKRLIQEYPELLSELLK